MPGRIPNPVLRATREFGFVPQKAKTCLAAYEHGLRIMVYPRLSAFIGGSIWFFGRFQQPKTPSSPPPANTVQ
jgi:hypothetical protein